jgi:hypothetical protein
MVTDDDGSRAVVGFYRVLGHPLPRRDRLVVRGLDPSARYEVTAWSSFDGPDGTSVRGGDELLALGLRIEPPDPVPADAEQPDAVRLVRGDFQFRLFDLRRVDVRRAGARRPTP